MRYFQKREEWKITDLLMNPMVMMMVLPLLLITVLPKMMGDPETQREMQEMQRNMANTQNQVNLQKNILKGTLVPKFPLIAAIYDVILFSDARGQ